MAKLETKPLVPPPPAAEPELPVAAAAGPGYVNSLGMKFAPVGDVLFCIWQTRVKDFEAFAKATGLKSLDWKDPGFKQGSDHPVVRVTWQEANLFCKWLTARERKDGRLASNQEYRLPTDLEWSRAVGLPEETGKTPESRDMSVPDVYPWGTQWPPPAGAGNYTGEETGSDVAIRGYNDGFPWTSPVGQFPANQFGLYDMGGNVWQWCQDTWSNESKAKVLRGASWYNGALKLSLLSSCRVHAAPDGSTDNYGFRVVIASTEGEKPARK
jgi:formylglycine-generating enzyme required for sulfatase activity